MDADERETGYIMLEKNPLVPSLFIVAITAVLTQITFVRINGAMAVDARGIA